MRELISYKFEKFKTGAFRIAYETNFPILPITLKNTDKGLKGIIIDLAEIDIIINEPFFVNSKDYDFYIEKSKNIISSHF